MKEGEEIPTRCRTRDATQTPDKENVGSFRRISMQSPRLESDVGLPQHDDKPASSSNALPQSSDPAPSQDNGTYKRFLSNITQPWLI